MRLIIGQQEHGNLNVVQVFYTSCITHISIWEFCSHQAKNVMPVSALVKNKNATFAMGANMAVTCSIHFYNASDLAGLLLTLCVLEIYLLYCTADDFLTSQSTNSYI